MIGPLAISPVELPEPPARLSPALVEEIEKWLCRPSPTATPAALARRLAEIASVNVTGSPERELFLYAVAVACRGIAALDRERFGQRSIVP